jgi:hypothetical protein
MGIFDASPTIYAIYDCTIAPFGGFYGFLRGTLFAL